ncbi:MAG: L,D-transpeptidase [Polyangiaceae bacterium]|nr:L,D-transpeptidase [Polyangiaceae bacterium]
MGSSTTANASHGRRSPRVTSSASVTTRSGSPTAEGRRPKARARTIAALVLAALALSSEVEPARAAGSQSSDAGPWTEGTSLPPEATAVRIKRADEYLYFEPAAGATRRGSAAKEARLPLFGARNGPGCREPWYAVGPSAWVCGDHVELTRGAPVAAASRTFEPSSDGLPYRYYFVGPSGSYGHKKLLDADIKEPDVQLEPGFAVAIMEERSFEGERWGLSGNGLWIPLRDLGPTRPFSFQGSEVPAAASTTIPFAWVYASSARVFSGPSTGQPTAESIAQFVKVDALEEAGTFEKMTRIGDKRWVRSKDVRRPTVAAPPDEVDVAAKERWVDVELATQTLVAYEGSAPVFATLVSTGKGKPGTANATPTGVHRVWVKLSSANMDNLEDDGASRFWRMENVPYVQYFSKGVGLHGAYWHRSFGNVRSHGCVNLAPLDAQRLFWFTGPRLPAGWTAILPTSHEKGAVVRVR